MSILCSSRHVLQTWNICRLMSETLSEGIFDCMPSGEPAICSKWKALRCSKDTSIILRGACVPNTPGTCLMLQQHMAFLRNVSLLCQVLKTDFSIITSDMRLFHPNTIYSFGLGKEKSMPRVWSPWNDYKDHSLTLPNFFFIIPQNKHIVVFWLFGKKPGAP